MKTIWSAALIAALLLTAVLPAGTAAAKSRINPEDALRKYFPKLNYTSIEKTDIDGLYEVTTDGKIIYFHPATGYVIVGNIYTHDGRDLTVEKMEERLYKLLTPEDLKKAIKVGNGRNKIIEVTDPDCPFCRKMYTYWESRDDVTRYIFFRPLEMHPDAVKKATYILASPDVEKALFEVYSGQLDGKREILDKKYDDKGRLAAQREVAEKLQVNSTPAFWVNGKFVSGANVPLIEKYIGKPGGER